MLGVQDTAPQGQPLAAPATVPEATNDGTVADGNANEGGAGPAAPEGVKPASSAKGPAGFKPPVAPPVTEPAPAYAPNFKFKVLDKELEFDEFIRPAIKDAEVEKKIRDLYERAHGLDSVKSDRQTLRSELTQTKEKMGKTDAALETLGGFVQKGDFDSFFESLNIPKQNILQYALSLVQREQWTPEQKAQWDASRQAQQQAAYYQGQNQELEARQQQFVVQQKEFELANVVSRPELQGIIQAYETGMGSPGAFRQYVIRIGQALEAQGQDVSAEQAVMEAVRHLNAVNPQLAVAPGGQVAPGTVQPNQKPVIPNIQGRGTSPVRTAVRTMEDLKKLARERVAQEG